MPKNLRRENFGERSQMAAVCNEIWDLKNSFNITQITVGKKSGEVLKDKERGEGGRRKRSDTQMSFRDLSVL
jgi:hypothetical protein